MDKSGENITDPHLLDHIKKLEYFARACMECINDINDIHNGISIFYNIDFSLLCPALFDRPPQGSAPFLDSKKSEMKRVLNEVKNLPGSQLVVSGPTVLEIFDQLNHIQRQYNTNLRSLHARHRRQDSILRDALKTSEQIRNDLAIFTSKGIDARVRAPIDRFLKLMDAGTIVGIGDVVDVDLVRTKTDKNLYEQFLKQHEQERIGYDVGRRARQDSLFHYKIDAANNCLTMAVSGDEDKRVVFVTPTPLNIRQCQSHARMDRTPLIRINLDRLKKTDIGNVNETDFLFNAARDAYVLAGNLKQHKRFKDVPGYLQVKIAGFLQIPMLALSKGSQEKGAAGDYEIEDIVKAVSDPRQMEVVREEAIEHLKAGAKKMMENSARFDLPFIEQFDFTDDPVLLRLKNELGVQF
jgi:hypothetical protein